MLACLWHVIAEVTTDSYAARPSGMLELSVTFFRYYQSPPILFEHTDYLTYLHINVLYQDAPVTCEISTSTSPCI